MRVDRGIVSESPSRKNFRRGGERKTLDSELSACEYEEMCENVTRKMRQRRTILQQLSMRGAQAERHLEPRQGGREREGYRQTQRRAASEEDGQLLTLAQTL